jgi:hypothetical protein
MDVANRASSRDSGVALRVPWRYDVVHRFRGRRARRRAARAIGATYVIVAGQGGV